MKYFLKTEKSIIPDVLDRDIEHFFVTDKITSVDKLYPPWYEVDRTVYELAIKMLNPSSDAMTTPDARIELDFINGVPTGLSMAIVRNPWKNEEEKEIEKQKILEHEAELREKGEL